MNITELAVKPSLVKVTLDDESIVEEYGEALEFFVWDRQPLEKFMRFAGKEITNEDLPELIEFTKTMILDEEGNEVMSDGKLLPTSIMTRCITKVMQQLGK
jgi:hypothetical protein